MKIKQKKAGNNPGFFILYCLLSKQVMLRWLYKSKGVINLLSEIQDRISGIKGIIESEKVAIADFVFKMEPNMKKGNLNEVRFLNNRIARCFEEIAKWEERLAEEEFELELEKFKVNSPGFEPVIEFLKELLVSDIKWHKTLVGIRRNDHEAFKGFTKVEKDFSKMTEKEALAIFQQDLFSRFVKLQGQIKEKAGEIKAIELSRNANGGFDGWAEGENRKVSISTIFAGGHSVQRLHYRTLVK